MPIAKKALLASTFCLIFSLLIWGSYLLAFKKDKSGEKPLSFETILEDEDIKEKERDSSEKIILMTEEAVISPTLSADGKKIFYHAKNGGIFEIDLNGKNKKPLAETKLENLEDILWSPDKKTAIFKTKLDQDSTFWLKNLEPLEESSSLEEESQLKNNLDNVAWKGDSKKIFYKFFDPQTKERTLNISDPNGNNWEKISDVSHREMKISDIPQSGNISIWNQPNAFQETSLEIFSLISKEKTVIFKEKFGADYLWDPAGEKILVSHSDSKGGGKVQLATLNRNGGEYKNLGFPTLVSKCVWGKNGITAYCAMPSGIPESSILPNDYLEKKFNTIDTFWRINTQNGEKERIIEPAEIMEKLDAEKMFLNLEESFLFFVNRIDGKLYRLSI